MKKKLEEQSEVYKTELIDRLELGTLDWENVCRECVDYLPETIIKDICQANNWFAFKESTIDIEEAKIILENAGYCVTKKK